MNTVAITIRSTPAQVKHNSTTSSTRVSTVTKARTSTTKVDNLPINTIGTINITHAPTSTITDNTAGDNANAMHLTGPSGGSLTSTITAEFTTTCLTILVTQLRLVLHQCREHYKHYWRY